MRLSSRSHVAPRVCGTLVPAPKWPNCLVSEGAWGRISGLRARVAALTLVPRALAWFFPLPVSAPHARRSDLRRRDRRDAHWPGQPARSLGRTRHRRRGERRAGDSEHPDRARALIYGNLSRIRCISSRPYARIVSVRTLPVIPTASATALAVSSSGYSATTTTSYAP